MYPVHGGAVAFYGGKFWVFGGSTGDDSYDHTITDKVDCFSYFFRFLIRITFHRYEQTDEP